MFSGVIVPSNEIRPSEIAIWRDWVTVLVRGRREGAATVTGDAMPEAKGYERVESESVVGTPLGRGGAKGEGCAGNGATDTAFKRGAARIGRGTVVAERSAVEFGRRC